MDPGQVENVLASLLGWAVLLPLISFFVILVAGPKMGKAGIGAGYLATLAIGMAAVLSFIALFAVWLPHHWPVGSHHEGEHFSARDLAPGPPVVRGQSPEEKREGQVKHESAGPQPEGHESTAEREDGHAGGGGHRGGGSPAHYAGEFHIPGTPFPWVLGEFGALRLSISYYIDSLTVCMFCMVSLISLLIHIYSTGYMHEELHGVTDHEVTTSDGGHLHRPGRYPRFFQYLSLFCFSMLGLVISGNVAMVFVFWELVGICSYFLIGFYIERKSASNAANKAFIVNRVGDFGMIVGMMALWSALGTFSFGDIDYNENLVIEPSERGIFGLVRPESRDFALTTPDGMVQFAAVGGVAEIFRDHAGMDEDPWKVALASESEITARTDDWRRMGYGYGVLLLAGIGIFCGCVGKSAQFPLHVWLPDAMEGPTPVSALVHSATMVAAGVYLVGRFYPVFAPEVLLVIAVAGMITLFLAATIAVTATDIKRVLAYSTVSQLGYMMMALGVGAWLAGMMHLITHAFFKSLLFLCSGSVIHAVHTNEMTEMGGLRKKMPVTAYTMLVGCLAIAGAGIPFLVGFLGGEGLSGLGLSGFYSKDAILEQAFSFWQANDTAWAAIFFLAAGGGAAITAFYMFRLWYMTFAGKPRDEHRYQHAHESPPAMYVPLVILSVMAVAVAWKPIQGLWGALIATVVFLAWRLVRKRPQRATAEPSHGRCWLGELPWGLSLVVLAVAAVWAVAGFDGVVLSGLLEEARPAGTLAQQTSALVGWIWPNEHDAHAAGIVVPVTFVAIGTAFVGFLLATGMYGLGRLSPDDVRKQFQAVYRLLRNKWWFDEIYDVVFVRPAHAIARMAAGVDRNWIDWIVDGMASTTRRFSAVWDRIADQSIVDGSVNLLADWMYAIGLSLRGVQTGRLRQYVVFIVVGAVTIFVLISFFWKPTLAG